jgi:hypothetical protein
MEQFPEFVQSMVQVDPESQMVWQLPLTPLQSTRQLELLAHSDLHPPPGHPTAHAGDEALHAKVQVGSVVDVVPGMQLQLVPLQEHFRSGCCGFAVHVKPATVVPPPAPP